MPHMPQDFGVPVQLGSLAWPATLEANVENFLVSRVEPQAGQGVPSQPAERTSTSESFPHFSQ